MKIAVAEGQVARVEVTVEVGGTIQDEIGDKAEPRPTTVNANLSYEERILDFPPAGKGDVSLGALCTTSRRGCSKWELNRNRQPWPKKTAGRRACCGQ